MKYSIVLLVVFSLFSCSSDDNPIYINEELETPIFKNMRKERVDDSATENYYFNVSGELNSFSSIATNYYDPDSFINYSYNTNNLLTEYKEFFETDTLTSILSYSNGIPSRIGHSKNNVHYESAITINNNVLSYIIPDYEYFDSLDAEVIITFETDQLKKIIEYRMNKLEPGNTTIYILTNFEYDSKGNLSRYGKEIMYGRHVNDSFTFTYDDSINPFAASLNQNAIPLILMEGYYRINIKNLVLISPNNIIRDNYHQKAYSYKYNIFNHPYSGNIIEIQTQRDFETLTFTYY
ncbi:hypothetical protein [Bizionia myxarmorum]|uniref:DUF4595 domain-containing protein n=1 Tax=Bizionia myxarmorum TaxID=291186 RepID=A0A5D0R9Q4_9FLAO|nr:hypothetical protein [Bizionia myxarmorum]TYB78217.1 hypothetical protein ES674_00100 [Bizionia myxarmorum]